MFENPCSIGYGYAQHVYLIAATCSVVAVYRVALRPDLFFIDFTFAWFKKEVIIRTLHHTQHSRALLKVSHADVDRFGVCSFSKIEQELVTKTPNIKSFVLSFLSGWDPALRDRNT